MDRKKILVTFFGLEPYPGRSEQKKKMRNIVFVKNCLSGRQNVVLRLETTLDDCGEPTTTGRTFGAIQF